MYQAFAKLVKDNNITGDFQALYAIYIQPVINNPILLSWLHSTSSNLEIRWSECRVNWKNNNNNCIRNAK